MDLKAAHEVLAENARMRAALEKLRPCLDGDDWAGDQRMIDVVNEGLGVAVTTPTEPEPDPSYIPPGNVEAWAKVDAYIQGLTIPGSDLDPDWFGTNFTEDGLNVNCIINIEVPVSVYRPATKNQGELNAQRDA